MDKLKLKSTLRDYHAFKQCWDSLFFRLMYRMKDLDKEKTQSEIFFLCRLFAEAKQGIECLEAEMTEEQKEDFHLKTLKDKWNRKFVKRWVPFLDKWTPRLQ